MNHLRFAVVVQDDGDIPRFARGLNLHEAWVKSTLLNMPRGNGASSLATRIRRALPGATQIGAYAWHYLTHRADDPLPGRGTRTINVDDAHGPRGHLQTSPTCDAALEASIRALEAFESRRLVIATPPSFTPGALGKRRLADFCQRAKELELDVTWEPTGLWDATTAIDGARGRAGVVVSSDEAVAALNSASASTQLWVRVGGGGDRVHWSAGQADELAYSLDIHDADPDTGPRLGFVFAGPKAFSNARTFQAALAS